MHTIYDLSALHWKLAGFAPHQWRFHGVTDIERAQGMEVPPIPAEVPGSVQGALQRAGLLPDWNVGEQSRACEWVENRHWVYQVALPAAWLAAERRVRLRCLGLDYQGHVLVNGVEVGRFCGTHLSHVVDLSAALRDGDNLLQIVFVEPPRYLGMFGYTSEMRAWKPRFNYTWDWCPRLVQTGIWDAVLLDVSDGRGEIEELACEVDVDPRTDLGTLRVHGAVHAEADCRVQVELAGAEGPICRAELPLAEFATHGLAWTDLPVNLWWPNGQGGQPLYTLSLRLCDAQGSTLDAQTRTVGFKRVAWQPNEGAPREADPWICAVNGRPVFLQGVNWTPIRPHFADVREGDYRQRIQLYHDLGCNVLRVWGGAFIEKECFYRLCDELGLMVWQEFPLSSSGTENWPPEDSVSIADMAEIAAAAIARCRHHVSLLVWCGGNELQGALDGNKVGRGKPVDATHPLIHRLAEVVEACDPMRRFLPTSGSGPRHYGQGEFGLGVHWDVHGPWKAEGDLAAWEAFWRQDDALMRSEVGAPGASSVEIIRRYRGDLPEMPATEDSPLWRRVYWWIEWDAFVREMGREPQDLEEYVAWSRQRQAWLLATAARASKARFPRCGGFIVWMGHDCFPCAANTSIVDYDGCPKPAALALGEVFRESQERFAGE
ncbi:MAG: glycosyl hydrolase 2 galactose-binding domain-containing protein [Anaerolineae bacterium]